MAKITFIEPASDFNAYGFARLPLLGTLYLGTMLKQQGHDVKIMSENIQSVYDEEKNRLDEKILSSDVVGFSTMTPTVNRGYQIADAIREQKPNTKIMFGGPHVSSMPEEALQHGDVVVQGEAEGVISDAINGNGSPKVIKGKLLEDLDELPFPDFSLLDEKPNIKRLAPIATSRGCPFDCTFCSVSSLFGRKYRFRSADNILGELQMRVEKGYQKFFFYDDNFGASKEIAKTMLDGVLTRNLKFKWLAQSRVEIVKDEELLKMMSRANCEYIFVGFESANPNALKGLNKRQDVEDIRRCIDLLHKHNIKVHGMFMIGADEDDVSTIEHTVKFCRDMNIDLAQFSILFPIPGTQLYDELESQGRIFTKNWSWYDGTHVVFHPKKISLLDLQEKFLWTWKKFYSMRRWKLYLFSRYLLSKWERCNKQFWEWFREFADKTQDFWESGVSGMRNKNIDEFLKK